MIPNVNAHRKVGRGCGICSDELTVDRVDVSIDDSRGCLNITDVCSQVFCVAKDVDIKWFGLGRTIYIVHPASQSTELVVAFIVIMGDIAITQGVVALLQNRARNVGSLPNHRWITRVGG